MGWGCLQLGIGSEQCWLLARPGASYPCVQAESSMGHLFAGDTNLRSGKLITNSKPQSPLLCRVWRLSDCLYWGLHFRGHISGAQGFSWGAWGPCVMCA